MRRFKNSDIQSFEQGPTSPGSLRKKVAALIESSTTYRAKVDSFDHESGQYRIVLQGTLDTQDNPFEEE
jgi:hypothetical protein